METKLTEYVIGQAEYPAYPAFVNAEDYYRKDGSWDHEAYERAQEDAQRALEAMGKTDVTDTVDLLAFADAASGRVLLRQNGENGVFSPVSLYVAMAMLAELTDGESREQVLSVLGAQNAEQLRSQLVIAQDKSQDTGRFKLWKGRVKKHEKKADE